MKPDACLARKLVIGLLVLVAVVGLTSSKLSAQTYTDLHDFNCATEGCGPTYPALLAQGRDGNLYGTTDYGPGNSSNGTVFKITPSGKIVTLYTFDGKTGSNPQGGLTLGPDGNFYGTTQFATGSYGMIFKITPAGTLTTLHVFNGGTDGTWPTTPPVLGSDGNFYGNVGGGNSLGLNELGGGVPTLGYRITTKGEYTVLTGSIPGSGASPWAPLMQASDGNFYSTTYDGGTNDAGTVYKMSPKGVVTVIYNFDTAHGGWGYAPLVQDTKGYLYGTEAEGGSGDGGVVFKITRGGELTVLYNFDRTTGGTAPGAGLVLGTDGKLYAPTYRGGSQNCGVLFDINGTGNYNELYDLDGPHGCEPEATGMQHTNGKIYSLASGGGAYQAGVVYSLNVGLQPFVRLVFTVGKVGRSIGILGQGFKGATSVSFNGTPATFRVVSGTYLVAKVPVGATTGSVTVATPKDVLKSNKEFRVKP
jgi:uncharacterized repeat protein (TIGR03803 family)